MISLIDLDPLVYQYGYLQLPDGRPFPARMAARMLDEKCEDIRLKSGGDTWIGHVSGAGNFRVGLATIRKYKGTRSESERPPLYGYLRGHLMQKSNVVVANDEEADDTLSIAQYKDYAAAKSRYNSYIEDDPIEEQQLGSFEECQWMLNTVICTIDKDLDMVPGLHYRWSKGNVKEITTWYQSVDGGLIAFYKQCLTGDSVDNIPGLRGVGPKSTHVTKLDSLEPDAALDYVKQRYTEWYGNYGDEFLLEVGRLLWMRSEVGELWNFPEDLDSNLF
tara:strand:+ start:503 stop:1330 length:828 start_codon:yes stop_codon:yes gene_type:complete